MAGECAMLTDVFVHADHYSLVAAMSVDGYLAAEVIDGLFDHEAFFLFIADKVVSSLFLQSCHSELSTASCDESFPW